MLLNFTEILKKYKIQPKAVIVVGAHWGEEHNDYLANGISRMVYIEPCAKAFEELKRRFRFAANVKLFNLACGDEPGQSVMYTGDNTVNQGQSNSLLKPLKHKEIHPTVEFTGEETVDVDLLDNLGLANKGYDLLVMDAQGYEGYVLRGGKETLKQINWVYTEINFDSVYGNCTQAEELDALLSDFERVETGGKVGGMWSDALYIRKSLLQ